jgi:hypothetical protein
MANKEKKKKKIEEEKAYKRKKILTIGIIFISAVVIVLAAYTIGYFKIFRFEKAIPKEAVRNEIMGTIVNIENPRVLADLLRVADNFAAEDIMKDEQKIGEDAVIVIDNPDVSKSPKIPQNVNMLLVVDNDLKILGIKPFNPSYFDLGISFNKFFNEFKGKDALQLISQNDGIDIGDSDNALLIKNKVKEVMALFYIEKYGDAKYDSLSNGSYVFPEKGAKITPIQAKDINGNEINFESLTNYKLFIIAGNPNCGGCVESIDAIGADIKKYDLTNIKFIVLSFSSDPKDAQKLISPLPEGTIGILDTNEKLSTELKINNSPSIALLDKNLTLFYRGPAEPTIQTLAVIKDFLQGSQKGD